MADVDEIIDFIKSLRKGFDKDLFQSKIDELAYTVDTVGLAYEDFHTLFKIWLNLSLPITKWVNLGSCLAPSDIVEERTVHYALRWILANNHDQANFPRLGYLLDWLTVAMDCGCIDMTALDIGYDVFYSMLSFDMLAVHAVKLVYTLTKPVDVTRKKVLALINRAKQREAQKSMLRPLQVLLGLFKSYKPECVPEDIPAISIYAAFKKPNKNLLVRFKNTQDRRSCHKKETHLTWINPINCEKARNKKDDPLVPNVMFITTDRDKDERANNFLNLSDPASVLQMSVHGPMSRPAQLRALLSNTIGQVLLAILPHTEQAFLARDLTRLLHSCFLEESPFTYVEKQDLLQKLATFQRTLVQGIPPVTKFLADFLPFWNENDYFAEIMELVEWVSVEHPEQVQQIVRRLSAVYLRAAPLEQCAILRATTNMYTNLVYSSTRSRQHFLSTTPCHNNYETVLPAVATTLTHMYHKGLQVDPDDLRVLYSSLWSVLRRARVEKAYGARLTAIPTPLTLALPLVGVSPALIDNIGELLILYKKIMSSDPNSYEEQIQMISEYVTDILNCLYSDELLSGSQNGLLFKKLHPQLVEKLNYLMPDVNSMFNIRNHLAFAPYTYIELLDAKYMDADKKELFHLVLEPQCPRLGLLIKKTLPELRHY